MPLPPYHWHTGPTAMSRLPRRAIMRMPPTNTSPPPRIRDLQSRASSAPAASASNLGRHQRPPPAPTIIVLQSRGSPFSVAATGHAPPRIRDLQSRHPSAPAASACHKRSPFPTAMPDASLVCYSCPSRHAPASLSSHAVVVWPLVEEPSCPLADQPSTPISRSQPRRPCGWRRVRRARILSDEPWALKLGS
jgi:hypothetical protein